MTGVSDKSGEQRIVIIGASQAGGRAAEALKLGGHGGPITLIGEEQHVPYERPALSKELLADGSLERLALVRPQNWYQEAGIDLLRERRAERIDRQRQVVTLDDRSEIPFDRLILATGSRARPLAVEGADHPACTYLRTIEDSLALQRRLRPGAHVVVIGAGFIGLEVAAAARSHGCDVTVLEIAALPMARGVPPLVGTYYARLHRGHGVVLRTGTGVSRITDAEGRAAVHVGDDRPLVADAVVIGVGVVPNVELAAAAGLAVDNGIVTDEFGRTSDPRIYAAGDVTNHFNPLLGRRIRLESWQNAQNQAIAVGRHLLGGTTPYAEVPWFWSDQFGVNLQIAGVPEPADEIVRRGTLGDGPTVLFHLRGGKLQAAIGLDAGRDIRFTKEIIALGGQIADADLADPAVKLADLHRALKRAAAPIKE